jgi:hypothetical protein
MIAGENSKVTPVEMIAYITGVATSNYDRMAHEVVCQQIKVLLHTQ